VSGESANQRVRADIAGSLERMERDQLVELLSDLIKIYVIEGATPASVAPNSATAVAQPVRPIGFAQLISDLKARFDLPELDYFRVEGDRVSVTVGEQTFPLEGRPVRRRSTPDRVARPEPSRREARPVSTTSERSRYLELD
jgi:hypothetical protein